MTAKDWSREIAAITPFVAGQTVAIQGSCPQPIPGVTKIIDGAPLNLAGLGEGTVDSIVGICCLSHQNDLIAVISGWRRALKEGGSLALVVEQARHTPQDLTVLINLVGGFEVHKVDRVVEGESWLLAARRSQVAEVRMPLGVQGANLASAANQSPVGRAELYFQFGTILVQCGDPSLAETCFKNLLALEPNNAEAHFGLGMSYSSMSRWSEALTELLRAQSLQPTSLEIERWIELARSHTVASEPAAAIPQPIVTPRPTVAPPPKVAPPPAVVSSESTLKPQPPIGSPVATTKPPTASTVARGRALRI